MKKARIFFSLISFFVIRSFAFGQIPSITPTPSPTPTNIATNTPTFTPTPTCNPQPSKPCPTATPTPITPTQTSQQPASTSAPASSSSDSAPAATEAPTPASAEATIASSPTPTETPTPTPEVLGEQTEELDRFDVTVVVVDKKSQPIKGVRISLGQNGDEKKTGKEGKVSFANIKRGKHTFFAYYHDEIKIKIVKTQGATKEIETTFEFERKSNLLSTLASLFILIGTGVYLFKKGYLKKLTENPKFAKLFAPIQKLINKLPRISMNTKFLSKIKSRFQKSS